MEGWDGVELRWADERVKEEEVRDRMEVQDEGERKEVAQATRATVQRVFAAVDAGETIDRRKLPAKYPQ